MKTIGKLLLLFITGIIVISTFTATKESIWGFTVRDLLAPISVAILFHAVSTILFYFLIKKEAKNKLVLWIMLSLFFIGLTTLNIIAILNTQKQMYENSKNNTSNIEKVNIPNIKSDRIIEFSFPHELTRENLSSQMYMDSYFDSKFSVLFLKGIDNEEITFEQKSQLLNDKIKQMYNLSPQSIKVLIDEKVGDKNVTIMTAIVGDTDLAVYYFVTQNNLTNILLYTYNTLDNTATTAAENLRKSIDY